MLFLAAFGWALLTASPAHAYAWMIRHGVSQCGSCHVDPMGGETLAGMGRAMGETKLAFSWSGEPEPSAAGEFLFGVGEPENVRLGGSLRALSVSYLNAGYTSAFPMQADLYGAAFFGRFTLAASVGVSKASARYEHSSKAKLVGNVEDEGRILVSRNHWLGYRFDDALMLRAGRINLPFGVRTSEHVLWVRSETLTDRESDQLDGVSLVYSSGAWRGELMAALGNLQAPDGAFQQRGYSGYVEYLVDLDLALGLSSLFLSAPRELEADSGAVVHTAHGLTLRYVPAQPLVILAEANALKVTGYDLGFVGMTTFDFEPIQGLHLALTGELLKRELTRAGGWLTWQWFVLPHVDLRLDVVLRQERQSQLLAQLHIYL
ncbi:MAG: hypothetical protein ABW217_14995 [Polyangiaceae bacterium]